MITMKALCIYILRSSRRSRSRINHGIQFGIHRHSLCAVPFFLNVLRLDLLLYAPRAPHFLGVHLNHCYAEKSSKKRAQPRIYNDLELIIQPQVPVELLYWVVEDLVGTGEENGGAPFSDLDVTHPDSTSKDFELPGQGSVSATITQQEQEHSKVKRTCGLTTPPWKP